LAIILNSKLNLIIFVLSHKQYRAFILVTTTLSAPSHSLQVSFINVGQGDAALVQDASGVNILIDAGIPAAGPPVVAFLREQGVDKVDVVITSRAEHHLQFGVLQAGRQQEHYSGVGTSDGNRRYDWQWLIETLTTPETGELRITGTMRMVCC
jgi:hypothetical protein